MLSSFVCHQGIMSVQIIVIIIRLSSRHHVCSDNCYRHSSVIKASCLFRSLLSSFVCHQGIMSVQILVIVIRLSSRHHVCSDHCYRHSSVIKASCLFRSLLSSFAYHLPQPKEFFSSTMFEIFSSILVFRIFVLRCDVFPLCNVLLSVSRAAM